MISYRISKKQLKRIVDQVFCKRYYGLFIAMGIALLLSLIPLIVGLTVERKMFDYFDESIGVFLLLGIFTLVFWLGQRRRALRYSIYDADGFLSYSLIYDDEGLKINNIGSGNVYNCYFTNIRYFYDDKEVFTVQTVDKVLVSIIKNEETQPLIDYLQTNYNKAKRP